ncbi:Uncharacterised protein [Streptococcus pneumoniae]|nr:Uncharacterised protein [Streptococcus pneumoniae]
MREVSRSEPGAPSPDGRGKTFGSSRFLGEARIDTGLASLGVLNESFAFIGD